MTKTRMLAAMMCIAAITVPALYATEAQTVHSFIACGFEQPNPGNCPRCKSPLAKNEISYECPHCGMIQLQGGTCSMCGEGLKRKKLPL